MPPKHTKDPRILDDPRARHMLLVERAMEELSPQFERLDPPVTYHTYFGDFSGGPGMTIWYAFGDRAARERAEHSGLTERMSRETQQALVRHGYAPTELHHVSLFFTSDDEIEAGGGRFYFFR